MARFVIHSSDGIFEMDEPPESGDWFLIDANWAIAYVGGKLYIDGRLAEAGHYSLSFDGMILKLTAGKDGVVQSIEFSRMEGGE